MKFPSLKDLVAIGSIILEAVKLAIPKKKELTAAEKEKQRHSQAANAAAHRASVEVNKHR